MNRLIVTAALGYGVEQLRPFLASARRHSPDAEIVIFSDGSSADLGPALAQLHPRARIVAPPDLRWRRFLGRSRRRLRSVRDVCRPLWRVAAPRRSTAFLSALLHVSLARYLWFDAHCRAERPEGLVLLSDSRDVYFQDDPFGEPPRELTCGEEPVLIGHCGFNAHWLEEAYSKQWAERLRSAPALCSGVVVGNAAAVSAYVAAMAAEIRRHRARLLGGIGLDQGLHNKLLQGDRALPFTVARNGGALLATLHHSDLSEFRFDPANGLCRREPDGPVAIVHQYDRHPRLRDWVGDRYGSAG